MNDNFKILIGAKVKSISVGDIPEFDGEIIDVLTYKQIQFVVMNLKDGSCWIRTPEEIGIKNLSGYKVNYINNPNEINSRL